MKKIILKWGNLVIGRGEVFIEAMTKTKTSSPSFLRQAKRLIKEGAQILRFAVKDKDDLRALSCFREKIDIPLIADIHFQPQFALEALEFVDCARINPLNITSERDLVKIALKAKKRKRSLRVGVNAGGVRSRRGDKLEVMLGALKRAVGILEKEGFFDIMISAKTYDVCETLILNEKVKDTFPFYPLHIGITAAGPGLMGVAKSCVGIGVLLYKGIGDTLRVSLTDSPLAEVRLAKCILQSLGKGYFFPEIISCPTCGRAASGFLKMARDSAKIILSSNIVPLKVAVMGCEVNGPGEAKGADLGFAFSQDYVAFFKEGDIKERISTQDFFKILKRKLEECRPRK